MVTTLVPVADAEGGAPPRPSLRARRRHHDHHAERPAPRLRRRHRLPPLPVRLRDSLRELGSPAVRASLADAALPGTGRERLFSQGAAADGARPRHAAHWAPPASRSCTWRTASASGPAAFPACCIEVAAGLADIVLVVGSTSRCRRPRRVARRIGSLATTPSPHSPTSPSWPTPTPAARRSVEDIALVAVKNPATAAQNPFAQHQGAHAGGDPRRQEDRRRSPRCSAAGGRRRGGRDRRL